MKLDWMHLFVFDLKVDGSEKNGGFESYMKDRKIKVNKKLNSY